MIHDSPEFLHNDSVIIFVEGGQYIYLQILMTNEFHKPHFYFGRYLK